MSRPTGASTPGWVIWLMVAVFIAAIVGAVEASKKSGPDGSPSPTVSAS